MNHLRAILLFYISIVLTTVDSYNETHYKAAVVEFHPAIGNVTDNLLKYLQFIEEAGEQDVDIIIFPEMGLTGRGPSLADMITAVPHPDDDILLCGSDNPKYNFAIKQLSCTSRQNHIYSVINLSEFTSCPNNDACDSNTTYKFNTNVVFDRNGRVIARYRKHNLYNENGTTAAPAELIYFDTDFGVRFGTFICFDILFDTPALNLTRQLGIKHIAFSTAWYSELPFLNAIQAFSSWSYSQDAIVLVSGYNAPEDGTAGSAILLGRSGAAAMSQNDSTSSHLFISNIPKLHHSHKEYPSKMPAEPSMVSSQKIKQLRQDLSTHETALVNKRRPNFEHCFDDFCCKFTLDLSAPSSSLSSLRAVAFDGVRDISGFRTVGLQTCALVVCANDKLSSCGTRVNSNNIISSVTVSGTFTKVRSNIMPTSAQDVGQVLPLDSEYFNWNSTCDDDICNVTIKSTQPLRNVLTFGIYSRVFSRDGQKPTLPRNAAPNPRLFFLGRQSLVAVVLAFTFRCTLQYV